MHTDLECLRSAVSDRYDVRHELGSGGSSVVIRARDRQDGRVVAIKVLLPMISASMGVERFLREIQIMRQLRHRNILQILDAGAAQGLIYYVMPYVSGPSLRDRLDDQGLFPIPQALVVARAAANALDYAHAHEVVHRDIKPENVLFDGRRAKLNDFGIAIAMSKSASERITEPGLVLGTAAYMSPEQAYGDVELDGRSDEYGLGCIVYEMLCGEVPFTGMTTTALMWRKVTARLPSLCGRGCDVPPEFDKVVAKSLARERSERFATAGDFVDALTEAWANSN